MRLSNFLRICTLFAAACLAVPGAAAQTSMPPYDLERVAVGTKAPDFELPDASGGRLALSSLRGKTVVLVFYRGYW
jgi:cytochrome oxidase Cu insertion factor (SCO1/SenC/PrrC family)